MRSTRALRPLLALTCLLLPLGSLRAQRYWHDAQGGNALRLDVAYPLLKGDGYKFPTFAAVPSMSVRAAEGIRVEADFPFERAGYDYGTAGSLTAFRIGNPYIGFRIGDDAKPFSGTLGARIPVSKSPKAGDAIGQQAVNAAVVTNFDDYEAFSPDIAAIRAALEGRWLRKDGLLLGAKLGASILIATNGNPLAQTVKYFDYGGRAGYAVSSVQATFALTGRLVSQSTTGSGFSARTHHAATGAIELRKGMVRPRVSLRVPFDKDLRDPNGGCVSSCATAILGLGVTIMP
jgi:hypothetical protein